MRNYGCLQASLRASFACLAAATMIGVGAATTAAAAAADGDAPRLRTVHHATMSAPAAVPDGYVITPAGYFHPSCVHHVQADNSVNMRSGDVLENGLTVHSTEPCAHPRFLSTGKRIDSPASARFRPPAGSGARSRLGVPIEADTLFVGSFDSYTGWIESVWANPEIGDAISYQRVDFQVPLPPPDPSTSVIYLFPGAQALAQELDPLTIIQPVLGWNSFVQQAWTIASWNCCVNGNTNYSDHAVVQTGDTIRGTMQGTGCNTTTGVCPNWAITTADLDNGASVTLNTTAYDQAFNWVFGGALEVYYVDSCEDIPASPWVDFLNFVTLDVAGQNRQYDYWMYTPSASVQCGFNIYELNPHTAYRLTF